MIELLTPELNKRYATAHGCKIDRHGYITDSPDNGKFEGQPYAAFRLWDLREQEAHAAKNGVYQFAFDRAAMAAFGLGWHLTPSVNTYYVALWEKGGKVHCSVHYTPVITTG